MDQVPIPFDEFEHGDATTADTKRGPAARFTIAGLRLISFAALWVAIVTAALVVVRHAIPSLNGYLPVGYLKSAIPLIAIGVSYNCLMFTLPRKPGQLLVGIFMGLAFILWGAEQYLTDRVLISFIDDCVVFLFVTDLSIVIRQNFRERRQRRLPPKG